MWGTASRTLSISCGEDTKVLLACHFDSVPLLRVSKTICFSGYLLIAHRQFALRGALDRCGMIRTETRYSLGRIALQEILDKERERGKLDRVLEAEDTSGKTPLIRCAAKGSVECLQLVSSAISTAAQISTRITCASRSYDVTYAIYRPDSLFPCLQLIDEGADVHHVSYYPEGTTALHEALDNRQYESVKKLISAGACPTLQNCKGYVLPPSTKGETLMIIA